MTPQRRPEPAITCVGLWGAEDVAAADSDGSRWFYCAVGRRPEVYPLPGRGRMA